MYCNCTAYGILRYHSHTCIIWILTVCIQCTPRCWWKSPHIPGLPTGRFHFVMSSGPRSQQSDPSSAGGFFRWSDMGFPIFRPKISSSWTKLLELSTTQMVASSQETVLHITAIDKQQPPTISELEVLWQLFHIQVLPKGYSLEKLLTTKCGSGCHCHNQLLRNLIFWNVNCRA